MRGRGKDPADMIAFFMQGVRHPHVIRAIKPRLQMDENPGQRPRALGARGVDGGERRREGWPEGCDTP